MKRVKACVVILSILITFSYNENIVNASELNERELYSLSAVMMDGDTGRILFEKNGYEIRAMASTTKIMTLILTLEYGNLEDIVTVSDYASKMPDVQLGIKKGEQYKLSDLVYSLMLESHNDSAVAIAEHIGGSKEGFANMMNKKAAELGLSNTYFITPNGIDEEDENGFHSTTAADLARLMKYCVMESPKKDDFIKICQTRSHTFSDYENKRSFTVENTNKFLDMMEGVIAGKTGFTTKAGYCYVAAIERDNKTYIVALLGCGWPNNKSYKWSDSKKLFNYGIENYDYKTVIDESYPSPNIKIRDGIEKNQISTYVKDELTLIVSDKDSIEIKENFPDSITAPVSKGDIVGTVDIYINEDLYRTYNVYSSENVKKISYGYFLKKVMDCYIY